MKHKVISDALRCFIFHPAPGPIWASVWSEYGIFAAALVNKVQYEIDKVIDLAVAEFLEQQRHP